MFHLWGFWFDLSIGSKHFSFHVLIFLLPDLLSARLVRKKTQHENWKLSIEKSYQSLHWMKNTISILFIIVFFFQAEYIYIQITNIQFHICTNYFVFSFRWRSSRWSFTGGNQISFRENPTSDEQKIPGSIGKAMSQSNTYFKK